MDTNNRDEDQTPIAPLRNPRHRHISRSAAKRESVQLLGSIKDLQAHFARAGFVEHRAGAGVGLKGSSNLNTLGEDDDEAGGQGLGHGENRPPVRNDKRVERRMWKEVELPRIDPSAARQEARRIASRMRMTWNVSSGASTSSGSSSLVSSPSTAFHPDLLPKDTRSMLVSTAQSIRTIRNLALAIAHSHRSNDRRSSASGQAHPRSGSKLRTSFSTPSRPSGMPRAVSLGVPERKSSLGMVMEGPQEDVHSDLRRAAIEVLASLRALEETLRVYHDTTEDDSDDMQRTTSPIESVGTSSTTVDASTTVTSQRPSSSSRSTNFSDGDEYYQEDEEEYNLNALAAADAENAHTQTWEERLVVEDRRYRDVSDTADIDGAEDRIGHVEDSVKKWLRIVERMFHVSRDEPAEMGSWVKPDMWEGLARERLQTFLTSYLPLQLQLLVPSTADSEFDKTFLPKLSDGYLLIQVFNTVVMSSKKPWGFVPDEDVHDTVSLGSDAPVGEASKEWTFRRIGNLTCWAAALRHRYNLPIVLPHTTSTSSLMPKPSSLPSRTPGPSPLLDQRPNVTKTETFHPPKSKEGQRIDFDPALVAKRGEGWEMMFETVLQRWLDEAAAEAMDGCE